MKKLVIGFFLSVLCLSVTGCGSSEEEKLYEKYKTLIDALEKEDYVAAVGEIYELAQGDNTQDNDEQSDEEKKRAEIEAAMKERSYGEWAPFPYYAEDGVTAFTMNEDGTCVIEGETYNWLVSYFDETYIRYDINSGETKKFEMNVNKYSDRIYSGASLRRVDENNTTTHVGDFYKVDEYTVVEITADNWQDYLELNERVRFDRNSFDELTGFAVERRYLLKEEYRDRIRGELSNFAVEYEYTYVNSKCTVDIETGAYELGEITKSWEPDTSISNMGSYMLEDDTYTYGFGIGSIYMDEWPEDTVSYYTDIKVLRMKGQLYFVNEQE